MQLTSCPNGHYYDRAKHVSCPHCAIVQAAGGHSGTQAVPPKTPKESDDEPKTIGIVEKKFGARPCVGWLVCIEGVNKGMEHRIVPGRNFIGRSDKMDIVLKGDLGISRENHAILSYDGKDTRFILVNGEGKSIIYLNREQLLAPRELNDGDIIEISETKLMFVPFCGERYVWPQ